MASSDEFEKETKDSETHVLMHSPIQENEQIINITGLGARPKVISNKTVV